MFTHCRFTSDFREYIIIRRVQQKRLLGISFICDRDEWMTYGPCADYRHDAVFRYNICRKRKSASRWTIFARPRMRLRQIMMIVENWIIKASITLATTFAEVTEASAVHWYEYCRDICPVKRTSLHESLGRFGKIVEFCDRCLHRFDYMHRVAVHKRYFVDLTTHVHTNNIEAMWSSLKEF